MVALKIGHHTLIISAAQIACQIVEDKHPQSTDKALARQILTGGGGLHCVL
jgi:hypothetical protein